MRGLPSRFAFVSNPVLCGLRAPPFGKTRIFRSSAGMLHAPVALQCPSFQGMSLQHHVLIHKNKVRSFFDAFDFIVENDSQSMAPTFVDGLLEGSCSFLRTLSCCKYPGEDSSRSHPSSCQEPRQSVGFSRLSFLQRFVELLAEDSWSVLLVRYLCHA